MSRYPEISADDPMVVSIAALVRAELEQEAAAAFPTLSRIPSSGIIRHLDYLATLDGAERVAQLNAQARLAALHFFPAPLIARAHERLRTSEPALLRRAEAIGSPTFGY